MSHENIVDEYLERNVREIVTVFHDGNVWEQLVAGDRCVMIRLLTDFDLGGEDFAEGETPGARTLRA